MSTPTVRLAPAKRGGQPEAVGQFPQQRRAGVPDHAGPVDGHFEAARRVGSLHPQGALLEPVMQPSDSRILPAREGSLRYLEHLNSTPHEKPRLVGNSDASGQVGRRVAERLARQGFRQRLLV
jgi:hypothetical protein